MKKKKQKISYEDFVKIYSEVHILDDKDFIVRRLKETNEIRKEKFKFINDSISFCKTILRFIFESKNPDLFKKSGGRFLNLIHLFGFYHLLIESFVNETDKKITFLEKSNKVKSSETQQYLLDDLGMLKIGGLISEEILRVFKEFRDFVKNTDFDENDPQHEMFIKEKLRLEETERKLKNRREKLFDFKI